MADYARPGDHARHMRSTSEQIRRLRTRRPRRGHIPSLTWVMEGDITTDRILMPALVTIDPVSGGDYPEYKRIVAFDGWLNNGEVDLDWYSLDNGLIYAGHHVAGAGARVVLPEPYVVSNGEFIRDWIQPRFASEPSGGAQHLACVAIFETVPI